MAHSHFRVTLAGPSISHGNPLRSRYVPRALSATAIVAADYGGPEVLAPLEVERPETDAVEVAVEVRAAGVDPIDYKLYTGAFGEDPAVLGGGRRRDSQCRVA